MNLQTLIRSMISLDPAQRLTCDEYLNSYRSTAFPDIFYTFLHPFLSALNDYSTPIVPSPSTPIASTATPTIPGHAGATLKTDADDRVERVWSEWEMIARYLDEGVERKEDRRPEAAETSKAGREAVFPVKLHIPGLEAQIAEGGATEGEFNLAILPGVPGLTCLVGCRRSGAHPPLVNLLQHPQLRTPSIHHSSSRHPSRPQSLPYRRDEARSPRSLSRRDPPGRQCERSVGRAQDLDPNGRFSSLLTCTAY